MNYRLMYLSTVRILILNDGQEKTELFREAEQMFGYWSGLPDFFGLAVVDKRTGEVIYLVQ